MNELFFFMLGAVVALSALLTTGLVRTRVHGIDTPKGHSMHTAPTPRLGGIAVMASTFAGFIVLGWVLAGGIDRSVMITLLCLFGLFICFVIEDVHGLSWRKRLALQFAFAAAFILASGVSGGIGERIGDALPRGVLDVVLVFSLVWAMNLYNFMDGMDGLAGGMSFSGFSTLGMLAIVTGHEWVGVAASAAAAGSLGFLVFNLPPARIFLGDAGSVPLGFLGAALGLILVSRHAVDWIVPLLVFAPFAIEATTTLVLRMLRGVAFWEPHRQHWYQRMVLAGWSHRQTLLIYYPLIALSAIAALAYHSWIAGRTMIVIGVVVMHCLPPIVSAWLESAHDRERSKPVRPPTGPPTATPAALRPTFRD